MIILNNKYLYFLIIVSYVSPWFIFGENSYVLIHDNLDSNVLWFKTLVESGEMFSGNNHIIPAIMSAPRVSFGNELDILLGLYYLFDPYTAYVLNQIIMRLVAIVGMYLLLDTYIFQGLHQKYSLFVAILYSVLPFWPSAGLSVAGLPLITYVLLNIKQGNDSKKDWVILILFPLYSSFILTMMFYIVLAGIVWLYDLVKRKVTLRFTVALLILSVFYLLVNYRLIEVFILGNDFVSHRVERSVEHYGLINVLMRSIKHFLVGQYHAHSIHIVFLPFISILFLINIFSKNKDKLFIGLFLLNVMISLWYGFWKYDGWESIKASSSLINSLNLSRFHFVTPLLWYVLFALSIRYYINHFSYKYKEYIVYLIIVVTLIFLFFKSDFVEEYRGNKITYKQFYSEALFDSIAIYIGKNKSEYRIASLGLHPAIAQYNGFYTLDGYLVNYPLKYKHQFRKIIKEELEKNQKLKKSFDNWGNRCYLFVDDVGYNFTRTKTETYPISVTLDTDILTKMGGKYIFSSYKIKNASENNLKLLKVFDDKDSAWRIYLYEII